MNNSSLYEANSKKNDINTNKNNLLAPIKENSFRNPSRKFIRSSGTATTKLSTSGSPRKAIKIIKPETIKRANNDAWMAAAIGDLEWLKNSLKISNEVVFDKNGFATLHLACIHGRLNIIKYLIEEQSLNINLPSSQGWCPIHLCINNNIGTKAVDCLKYLIKKGADINVKNNDGTYPLHIAASEGQVDCLRILLELKAVTRLTDNRGQTPLDLAKLWGHRNCAKYLNNEMWSNEKKLLFEENLFERQQRSQQLLKQVQHAYDYYFDEKELAKKNFEEWLVYQLNVSPDTNNTNINYDNHENIENLTEFEEEKEENSVLSNKTNENLSSNSHENSNSDATIQLTPKVSKTAKLTPEITPSPRTKEQQQPESPSLSKRKNFKPLHKLKSDWNTSIKANHNKYVPNLDDFYPRDPYTNLPTDADIVFLNKELKGHSMDRVRNLIHKDFSNFYSQSINLSMETSRSVVFKPKNVIDTQIKGKNKNSDCNISNAGLHLGSDPNSYQFKQLKSYGNYYNTADTLKKIKKQLKDDNFKENFNKDIKVVRDEKLEIVEKLYGKGLSDFMTDTRHGKINQKYEKVFIC